MKLARSRLTAAELGALALAGLALAGCSNSSASSNSSAGDTTPAVRSSAASGRPEGRPAGHGARPDASRRVGASRYVVQRQPAPGTCHARGSGLFMLPDPACTPGLADHRVTQANIHSTICVSGYTRRVRPPESVSEPEKRASLAAYGIRGALSAYEYDHLIALELGGAPNDPRNLWPEFGRTPNPKDSLERRLHSMVCSGVLMLAAAQRAIARNWVATYQNYVR